MELLTAEMLADAFLIHFSGAKVIAYEELRWKTAESTYGGGNYRLKVASINMDGHWLTIRFEQGTEVAIGLQPESGPEAAQVDFGDEIMVFP